MIAGILHKVFHIDHALFGGLLVYLGDFDDPAFLRPAPAGGCAGDCNSDGGDLTARLHRDGISLLGGAAEGGFAIEDEEVERDGGEGEACSSDGFGDPEGGDELPEDEGAQRDSGAEGEIVDAHDPSTHGVGGDELSERHHEGGGGHQSGSGEEHEDAGEGQPARESEGGDA